ncbi:MAG: hypothetical protein GY895_08910 [Phycisphaera sp.]|nr:hypothetical protein [Phycisphaera sp.]
MNCKAPDLLAAVTLGLLVLLPTSSAIADDARLEAALLRAGSNAPSIQRAIDTVPDEQRDAMKWLVARMPADDLRTLDADFLVENCRLAFEARSSPPWGDSVPEAIFLDAVLPYAVINERRDDWRADFRARFEPLVSEASTPSEAAALLNQRIFPMVGVKYSTKRPKADQSGLESIDAGLASCTGLSVLLVEACRSVGVPARFVGVPLWSDGSGNHSWVEIWDGGEWRFTGAAEPTGMELDRGWFAGRAKGAVRDDPGRAVWATTWNDSPAHFPMVWSPLTSVRAVNVTDRYTADPVEIPEGQGRLYVRLRDLDSGGRRSMPAILKVDGVEVARGRTRDDSFDANDHLEFLVPIGADFMVEFELPGGTMEAGQEFFRDEQIFDAASTFMAPKASGQDRGPGLSRDGADRLVETMRRRHATRVRRTRSKEMKSKVLEIGDHRMPFWYTTYGEPPEGEGRSLFISMHGGGGAPKAVNDQQWENQKRLYKPAEGVYLTPRAPTDTWNLWHQGHIDGFYDRLIENLVVLEGVDPDKVYFMGYSAGGDGVYQLAPRMADRLAAAAMMAGHPNETRPDGLRNLPFTLHMGGEDAAFDRNEIARQWKKNLAGLAAGDEGGYPHEVVVHEGKGHWMDQEDAVAVPWMARHRRNLRPERVVWLQDDVTHGRFYWLAVDEPKARERIIVERSGNDITIIEGGDRGLRIRLDDSMVDLDRPITVTREDEVIFDGMVPRSREVIERTLAERGDPKGIFTAEIVIPAEDVAAGS